MFGLGTMMDAMMGKEGNLGRSLGRSVVDHWVNKGLPGEEGCLDDERHLG